MKKKEVKQEEGRKKRTRGLIILFLVVFVVLIFLIFPIKRGTAPQLNVQDLQKAANFYANGDYAGAIKQYRQIIDKDPQNYDAYIGLGHSYIALSIHDGALGTFEKTKSLQYHDFRTYYGIGLTYYTMEDYTKAYANFKIAYGLNPNDNAVVSYLLNTYNAIGLYDETIKLAQDKIKTNQNNSHYYRKIALAYFLKNDLSKALENAQKAVELQSDYAPNHLTFGNIYLSLRQNENALNEFRTALTLVRSNPVYEALSLTYNLLGQTENSEKNSKSANLYLRHSFSLSLLGFALLNIKEYDKAINEFNSAIENTPNYYLPYKGLGEVYNALGQKDKAMENFEKAAKLNEFDEESKRLLEEAKK